MAESIDDNPYDWLVNDRLGNDKTDERKYSYRLWCMTADGVKHYRWFCDYCGSMAGLHEEYCDED